MGYHISNDVNNYLDMLRKETNYKPYKYSKLPNELKIKKIHHRLISSGIIKHIARSSRGNEWILMI